MTKQSGRSNVTAGALVGAAGVILAIVGVRATFVGERYIGQVRPIGLALIVAGILLTAAGWRQRRRTRPMTLTCPNCPFSYFVGALQRDGMSGITGVAENSGWTG